MVEFVEVFFVKKKDGRLRMVVDCRRSNCYFRDPHDVSLASGDALGRIEIHQGEELHIFSVDLKDAFYHIGLPMMLRSFLVSGRY